MSLPIVTVTYPIGGSSSLVVGPSGFSADGALTGGTPSFIENLYIGENNPTSIYFGSTQIQKVYIGSTIVYGAGA